MDSLTYIILLKNQSKNIPALVESLKAIRGKFRKEFIVVDDCSDDDTLEVARKYFATFSRCTILTNDEYHGPSYCVNKALSITHGKYVHFVDGDEILDPDSTWELLESCKAFGSAAAFGLHGKIDKDGNRFKSSYETGDTILLDDPIKSILTNSAKGIRDFGYSGTLMSTFLLEEMFGVDEHVFTHNMSMALSAAKLTKFTLVKKTMCYRNDNLEKRYDKKFLIHNQLQAIAHFMEDNPRFSEHYTADIYKALWSFLWHIDKKHKVKSLPRYFLSRYMKNSLDVDTLIELYQGYIEQI